MDGFFDQILCSFCYILLYLSVVKRLNVHVLFCYFIAVKTSQLPEKGMLVQTAASYLYKIVKLLVRWAFKHSNEQLKTTQMHTYATEVKLCP